MPCDVLGCKDTADTYLHGTYCRRHARMMAPRAQWDRLSVPYPEGQEPPRLPAPRTLTRPERTTLGPIEVIYAPCPAVCGRPTCYLPGQAIQLCLQCAIAAIKTPAASMTGIITGK